MQKLLLTIFLIGFSIIGMGKPIFFEGYSETQQKFKTPRTTSLQYNWDSIPDQAWLSYDFWCNSYLDWKVEDHKVVAYPFFKNKRTAHISGIQALDIIGDYDIDFNVGFYNKENQGYAGILIGLGSSNNNSKSNLLIHNNRPKDKGLLFACSKNGILFLKEYQNDSTLYQSELDSISKEWLNDSIGLKFKYSVDHQNSNCLISVFRQDSLILADTTKMPLFNNGNFALTYSCSKAYKAFAWFDNLNITGKGIQPTHNQTNLILSTFYNTQEDSLFLTVQLQPFQLTDKDLFRLELNSFKHGVTRYRSEKKYIYDSLAHQIRFRIKLQLNNSVQDYTINYSGPQFLNPTNYKGRIQKTPTRNKLTLMTLNCNGYPFLHEGQYDYSTLWYPYEQITKGYNEFKPDLLVFLGDQFYESRPNMPIYKAPFSYLDYLYKWNIYCLQFRELTANTPSIILTDDHDVYHSNLWGNNGTSAKKAKKDTLPKYYQENYDTWQQDNGGYLMTDTFVNMAIRSQTSHLPQPFFKDSTGLTNYFTSYQFGKFDFAILEDKKFKSAPAVLNIPIFNGQPLNDSLTQEQLNNDSLQLLGEKQLEFLTDFFDQNSDKMKIVLTQSAYSCLTTVDSASHPLKDRPATKSNQHKLNRDMDTNGWPKAGRDKAMSIIGPQPTLVLAGDQHLGSLVELYDTLGNGTYFYTTPSVANTWPRTWYPTNSNDKSEALGKHQDGFGNTMLVKAVANPQKVVLGPIGINSKSPGFGIIELNKFWRTAKIHAYPLNYTELKNKPEYLGWPVKIKIK